MQVQSLAIDGLDGSGKASCLRELAFELSNSGHNVITTAFPQYETYIGMLLKRVQFGELNCTQEQKMALYCLNRLETVRPIRSLLNQLELSNNLPTVLAFDRFSSSSILTYAYETVEDTTIDEQELEYTYTHMWELDTPFLDGLQLHDTQVYIPFLEAEEAVSAAQKDGTRGGLDLNEVHTVQERANELYRLVEQYDPRIHRISQYLGGLRKTAKEIARQILDLEGYSSNKTEQKGVIYELNLQAMKLDRTMVSSVEENMIDDHIMYLLEEYVSA